MHVKLVGQGHFGDPHSAWYADAEDVAATRAVLNRIELELAERLGENGGVEDRGFDVMMCLIWPLEQVPAGDAYARLFRRDRVFEVSLSLKGAGPAGSRMADRIGAIARKGLGVLADRLRRRGMVDLARTIHDYLAEPMQTAVGRRKNEA